jgi:hypothetical protein
MEGWSKAEKKTNGAARDYESRVQRKFLFSHFIVVVEMDSQERVVS